jgi:hypothetical protein
MNIFTASASLSVALLVGAGAGMPRVATPNAKPTPAQANAVKHAVAPDMRDDHFRVGFGDLNGDGRPDLIALYQGGTWCGSGGCTSVALLATANGYSSKAIDLPNFIESVAILSSMHNGMHDLKFDDATYIFKWNGTYYQ